MYSVDDYLPLFGVQHFAYCPRQWALIHIEQCWADNEKTVDGNSMHDRCHDELVKERRGDLLVVRGLRVSSSRLGLNGICDVVEFHRSDAGTSLQDEEGLWLPTPVEYKRGRAKWGSEDLVQVCAQAICLEEMLGCPIEKGFLFYGETRRRLEVVCDDTLRAKTIKIADDMHRLFAHGDTPSAKPRSGCNSCSLKELCLPELSRVRSVADYIDDLMGSGGACQ